MKWKINNRVVEDEHGVTVCVLSDTASTYHIAIIKNASDMFDAILDYFQSLETTSHPRNPKSIMKTFRGLLKKLQTKRDRIKKNHCSALVRIH